MIEKILTGKNSVFLGETGSGKTEVALNWAMALAGKGEKVYFFDMDQTKGLFRARDFAGELAAAGVHLVQPFQFQDAPLIPPGVTGYLREAQARCVFDVGGNATGAKMIGQFAPLLGEQGSDFCFLINPMRPFSTDVKDIRETAQRVQAACKAERLLYASNPCLGGETEASFVLAQHGWLEEALASMGEKAAFLAAEEGLARALGPSLPLPVLPLHLYVKQLYK